MMRLPLAAMVFTLFLAAAAQGAWVPLSPGAVEQAPGVRVLRSTATETVLEVTQAGFLSEERAVDGKTYHWLAIPGDAGNTPEAGKPRLPVIPQGLAVPEGARVEVAVLDAEYAAFSGYRPYPTQPSVRENDPEPPFTLDRAFYAKDVDYPLQRVDLSAPATWRDVQLVRAGIQPFSYNPARGELKVAKRLVLRFSYIGGSRIPKAVLPRFASMYRRLLVNYDALGYREAVPAVYGVQYLVLTHSAFASTIDTLVKWHQKRGVPTRVISKSSWAIQEMKDSITAEYNRNNPRILTWVLLVGDVRHMPTSMAFGNPSDWWFSELSGSDFYSEIGLGRFSARTAGELANQIAKTMKFEKAPPLDDWTTKVTLAAHSEQYPDKYSLCTREIYNYPNYTYYHPVFDTIMGGRGGTNAMVAADINQGRVLVNYRGHGGEADWWNWDMSSQPWTYANVNALTNGDHTPVVIACCCLNSNLIYGGGDSSIAEYHMKKYPGGAVAYLSASAPSYTLPNHDFDKGLFKCAYGDTTVHGLNGPIWDLGWWLNYGNAYELLMGQIWGWKNVTMYLWLGDPALEVWTGVPTAMTVQYPMMVPPGPSPFTVTVTAGKAPVDNALVCAWKQGETYELGKTNTAGQVTLDISPLTPGPLLVTVTHHKYLPFEGQAMVGSSGVEEESQNANFKFQIAKCKITPNPFTSFASIPGHEAERFALYDVSGRMVGTCKGDRVGEGLSPGVYFLRSSDNKDKPLRVVKVR